jgi:hypothetical protein
VTSAPREPLTGREHAEVRERRQRVEGHRHRLGAKRARVRAPDALAPQHQQRVEVGRVLDQTRPGVVEAVESTHHDLASRRARDQLRRQGRPDQRPRRQRPPELLEDQHGVGHPEPRAPLRLGAPQAEHAEPGELAPERAVEAAALELAQPLAPEPRRTEAANALGQGELLGGELEVH